MRSLIVTFLVKPSSRFRVLKWIKDEWRLYADDKNDSMKAGHSENHDDRWMREGGISPEGDWQRQITQYWDRANALGLSTPAGRQSMMKSLTTVIDCAAAMVRVYGDPPLPGYPSGIIRTHDWQKEEEVE